jgi:selenocysteine lyase/cysteine desulfurase
MNNRRTFLRSAVSTALLASPVAAAAAAPDNPSDAGWDAVRDQFLLARDKVFFNNGTIGVTPKVVVDRITEHLRKMATDIADWNYRGENWVSGYDPQNYIRDRLARIVNVHPKEIGLTENVSSAMSYVAAGLDLREGDEIVTSDQEHPGGLGSWLLSQKRRKTPVRMVKLPKPAANPAQFADRIVGAFTPHTRVLALSHVISAAGAIVPVKQICAEARSRGIFTVLDGAQAVGHIPVDLADIGCDAYVSCFHKWLLGPAGSGFLFLRQDIAAGVWATVANSAWDYYADNGYRFTQRGTGSLSLWLGVEAALDFHLSLGPDRVQRRIKYLGDHLRDALKRIPAVAIYSPSDPAMCAGITLYNVSGWTGSKLQDEMWDRDRLRVRAEGESFGVRQCTHIYNTTTEIDRTLRIVRQLAKA